MMRVKMVVEADKFTPNRWNIRTVSDGFIGILALLDNAEYIFNGQQWLIDALTTEDDSRKSCLRFVGCSFEDVIEGLHMGVEAYVNSFMERF